MIGQSGKMTHVVAVLCLLLLAVPLQAPSAQAGDPGELISRTVSDLLDELVARRSELEADRSRLYELVDRVVGPLFNFDSIAKLVLARNWRVASEAQRHAFSEELKRLVILTYSTSLFLYSGKETMEIRRTDFREKKGRQFATVHSLVDINRGEPIPVSYYMIRQTDGSWKIFNMVVGGLDLVLNYRTIFQSLIRKKGLDGTISSMKTDNDGNS